jgi:hypothetical protein
MMAAMDAFPPEALLSSCAEPMRAVAEQLRVVVLHAVPDAIERVRPRWQLIGYDVPIGRRTRYFAWVWPQVEHVHLGFEYGAFMDDPDGVLQGAGVTKRVRWLTFTPGDPIDEDHLAGLLYEAVRVAVMTRGERLLGAIDRESGPGNLRPIADRG